MSVVKQHVFLNKTVIAGALVLAVGSLSAAPGVVKTPGATAQPNAVNVRSDVVDAKMSDTLVRRFSSSGAKSDFAIEFRERADLSAAFGMAWSERGRYVHERLRSTAERSQAGVRRMLTARGLRFEPYWIKNVIVVRQGDLGALRAASAFDGVLRIRELPDVQTIEPDYTASGARATRVGGIGENIQQIRAPQAWARGATGSGVTVGVLDTGVNFRHEALRNSYRGNRDGVFEHDYNWYAPEFHFPQPVVHKPHGTHVTGTITGDDLNADSQLRNRIGVAPGADWIACLGLPDQLIFFEADPVMRCGEFLLAPTRTDGTLPDPDKRPHVINNSWSEATCNGSATSYFADMVDAWVAAGMFPVFAAGNTGACGLQEPPSLSTVSSPASLGSAFAVGSTGNHDGLYATHSLWGPTEDLSEGLPNYPDPRGFPQLKPQVVAPGVEIRSALGRADADSVDEYQLASGTSMSTPHIAGVVALMLDAGECLRGDYAALGTLLMQTARAVPYETGGQPPPGPGNVPNYATGWGEVDAEAAVEMAANACGPQGFVSGRITTPSGEPVGAATVEIFAGPAARVYTVATEADGRFIRRLPELLAGGYTVRVSAWGYLPASESGVLVSNGATTAHDVQLPVAPTYKISGTVTDGATGWPLHARVQIDGYTGAPIWTDPVTGTYSVRLPEGRPFRFDVTTDIAGYVPTSRQLASLSGGTNQNFSLNADALACGAPGYRYAITRIDETFESVVGAPPAGWTATSAGLGWLFGTTDTLSYPSFPIRAHGRFAAVNDQLGADGGLGNDGRNDLLRTPALNLGGVANPVLRFNSFWPGPTSGTRATVEGSRDGGATWIALGVPRPIDFTSQEWTEETISLAPIAVPGARIRFHADDGTTDLLPSAGAFWAIDDVVVAAQCTAPAGGGLAVGHVRDANTGAVMSGARVGFDSADPVTTFTSADPGVGEGFYAIHVPAGAPPLVARHAQPGNGYGTHSASPSVAAGTTALQNFALPAGRLRLQPLTATVEMGTTLSKILTATNSGTQAVTFAMEQTALEEHFDDKRFPPAGWTVQQSGMNCDWNVLNPENLGNFAGGDTLAAAINLGTCLPGVQTDTSLVLPPLDLSRSQTATLAFVLSMSQAFTPQRLDIDASVDGGASWTTVLTQSTSTSALGPGTLIEANLTPFVGPSDVRVRLRERATAGLISWVIVDQVHLFNGVSEHPLLNVNPERATLAAGASRSINVEFDARQLSQPGVYAVPIRVAEDTPYEWPYGEVEARMTVSAPASFGSIGGAVTSLGYCDINPRPLGDLPVTITPANGQSITIRTAADGGYRYWFNAQQGPFTVTTTADGHLPASRQVVVVAGAQSDGALGLRTMQSCLVADPAVPSVTLPSGQKAQSEFDLLNIGTVGAQWTMRAGGDPTALTPLAIAQTVSPVPQPNVSVSCVPPGSDTGVFENRYMRVFPLEENGPANRNVVVSGITFAVDAATTSGFPVTVRLHSLDGDLRLDGLQLLREKNLVVTDPSLQRVSVTFDTPLTVRGDTVLVADLQVDQRSKGRFFPGGNTGGESASGYWVAPNCGLSEPATFASQDILMNLILEIDTQVIQPCSEQTAPVGWLDVSRPGGFLDADASATLSALFSAAGRADGEYKGSLCVSPGSSPTQPAVISVTMRVGALPDVIYADRFE